jgi:transcriptional regulator with XRE-family HTH domain
MASTTLNELAERVRRRRELPAPEELKLIRKNARVSMRELAEVVGVAESTINAYEKGARRPRGRNLDRYLDALAVLKPGTPHREQRGRAALKGGDDLSSRR